MLTQTQKNVTTQETTHLTQSSIWEEKMSALAKSSALTLPQRGKALELADIFAKKLEQTQLSPLKRLELEKLVQECLEQIPTPKTEEEFAMTVLTESIALGITLLCWSQINNQPLADYLTPYMCHIHSIREQWRQQLPQKAA